MDYHCDTGKETLHHVTFKRAAHSFLFVLCVRCIFLFAREGPCWACTLGLFGPDFGVKLGL